MSPSLVPKLSYLELLNRDDRAWLKDLIGKEAAAPDLRDALLPWIRIIVTSLASPHHAQLGAVPLTLASVELNFAEWLVKNRDLDRIVKAWAHDSLGPWSLPYALSRSFSRFCLAERMTPKPSEFSEQWDAYLSRVMNHIDRLPFLLHLDGLQTPEIVALLDLDAHRVQELIETSKDDLRKTGT